jgi:hypothetical protein
MEEKQLKEAYKFSSNNRNLLGRDSHCACFYCLKIFSPTEINEWTDEESTAIALIVG